MRTRDLIRQLDEQMGERLPGGRPQVDYLLVAELINRYEKLRKRFRLAHRFYPVPTKHLKRAIKRYNRLVREE